MILVQNRIFNDLWKPPWRSSGSLNATLSVYATDLDPRALVKALLDCIEAVEPSDRNIPVGIIRMVLEPGIIKQIANFKMRLFWGTQDFHLLDKIDHVILIIFEVIGIK